MKTIKLISSLLGLLLITTIITSCGFPSMDIYETHRPNIQGTPKYGYLFKAGDTAFNKVTNVVYVIDSIDYHCVMRRDCKSRVYYATSLTYNGRHFPVGVHVDKLLEKVLIPYRDSGN